MISVHQMGEVLGKVSGCSCTQLAEFYSTEAGVAPMTVTRIFLSENVRVNGDWRLFTQNCGGTI